MKRIGCTSAAAAMAVVLAGGGGLAQTRGGSTGTAQPGTAQGDQRQGTQAAQAKPLDAREFINQITIANMAEIQLGRMAAIRA